MGQDINVTKQNSREEVEFNIASGERESNKVTCNNKSLLAALMLQNIESENVEVLGSNDDELYYPLSWNDEELGLSVLQKPWDIEHAYFPGIKDVSDENSGPTGVFFKPDGTKMFLIGTSPDSIHAYDLNAPWDITSASLDKSVDISAHVTDPNAVFFKPDGSSMFAVDMKDGLICPFDLSTAWDIETASQLKPFDVSDKEGNPGGVFFKPDGTKMFVIGRDNVTVYAYDLASSWNISTASLSDSFDLSGAGSNAAEGISFKPDGSMMFIMGANDDTIYAYNLSTPWDVATASLDTSLSVTTQDNFPRGIALKPDGKSMFIVGNQSQAIYSYSLSTAWDLDTGSVLDNFSVESEDITPEGIFFKPDGSKMFTVGTDSNSVYAYDLFTPWDVTSASLDDSYDVSSEDASPSGIYFKPDGSMMFVAGAANDSVYAYELSTAWDITTASLANFGISAENDNPSGIFFKPDGSMMYLISAVADSVDSYELLKPWDITTASLADSFDLSGEVAQPQGISFKPDGTKLFVLGGGNDAIYAYDLSSLWDISVASLVSDYDISIHDSQPSGIYLKNDGAKMFMIGRASKSVYSYMFKKNTWVSIGEPDLTKPYKYLKMRTSQAESGDRRIKGIIGV